MDYNTIKGASIQGGVITTICYAQGKEIIKKVALIEIPMIVDGTKTDLNTIVKEHRDLVAKVKDLENKVDLLVESVKATTKALETCLDYIKERKESEI